MDETKKETTMNIFQRINAVRKEINYIQKDKAVSTGGGSYRAVTHDAVTGMLRASLIEHGIIVVPSQTFGVFNPKEPDSKQRLYEATYRVSFINMDDPKDCVSVDVNAHALDNGDKAPGKAMSYATKYAMLKLFSIETGEDDESRYQRDEFDVMPFILQIEACETNPDLQRIYTEAYKTIEKHGDKQALKTIIAAKDNAKARIARVAA